MTLSYVLTGLEFGKLTFVPVQYLEMGFEKIAKIAHARGDQKGQNFSLRSTNCPDSKSTETVILSSFQKLLISPTDPEFYQRP